MHDSHFAVIIVIIKGRAKAANIIMIGKTINAETLNILL